MIIIFVFCSSVIADQILWDSCEFYGVENCLCTRALMYYDGLKSMETACELSMFVHN